MINFDEKLQKYADVILKSGLNLREGQRLWLRVATNLPETPPESLRLIYTLIERAYAHGASYVHLVIRDEMAVKANLLYAPNFDHFATWEVDGAMSYINNGDAYLVVYGANPDVFKDVPRDRMNTWQKNMFPVNKPINDAISASEINWLIVGLPVTGWAARVFPDVSTDQAVEKLWDAIFEVCRVNQPHPAAVWAEHVHQLSRRKAYLTAKQYTALHYRATGTDLTVGLPSGHVWQGGTIHAKNGITFTPNIPTEEVFTMPHRLRVNGTVRASMPLVTTDVIEGLEFTFKDGVVVDMRANSNQGLMEDLLNMDDGARMLGEVALVANSSPISKYGLFYDTLFDENAANHLALGRAYRSTLEGGEMMGEDEFAAEGGNLSLIHTDFMIGSGEMDVDGVLHDGSTEPLMRSGEWVV